MAKYINSEEFVINLDTMKNPDSEFATDDYIDGFSDGISAAIKEIEAFPTVDVAPVKHGHWYNRGGRFHCSVCDNKALLKDIGGTGGWSHEYEQQKSPYCPNCGAKLC